MHPNLPSLLAATGLKAVCVAGFLALAQAVPAAPAPSAAAADLAAVPDDTAPSAPGPGSTIQPGSTAVLRASGTPAKPAASETLDTASADETLSTLSASPAAHDSLAAAAAPKARDTVAKVEEPALVEAPGLDRLTLGGAFQLRAAYRDMFNEADAKKSLGLSVRRARLDFAGTLGEPGRPLGSFGFEGQFRFEDGRRLGSEAIYLAWRLNDLFGIKGGKLKRPFSQESMQSSKGLYTVERGALYNAFLTGTTGYAGYDLGLLFHGGFVDEDVPVAYEVGLFNGKQSDDAGVGYADQHYESGDAGLKAKDLVFRLVARPFKPLKVEASLSTKAAEDRTDPENFSYHVNTGYQVGAELLAGPLRILGECAWGDNHHGSDAGILSGTSLFFAFYGAAVWREDYGRGRASELVLKLEGLDPDFEPDGGGTPNDGRLRYTFGTNYFFTPKVSILANYNVLQPITEVPGDDVLTHDVDVMWRMSF